MGIIAAIANPWWINIYFSNKWFGIFFLLVGILCVWLYRQKRIAMVSLLMILLLIVQIGETKTRSLVEIANDDRRLIDLRLSAYPPITQLPIAHWLEQKSVTIASTRMADSFFENLDPNQYFFANHPRERIGHIEIQKLLFIFLPFSILGLIVLSQKSKVLLTGSLVGLIGLSIIGNGISWGNVFMYPVLLISIDEGGKCIRKFF